MSENEENSSDSDVEKLCFICNLPGDPINNKLKDLKADVLGKCIKAIEMRKNLP